MFLGGTEVNHLLKMGKVKYRTKNLQNFFEFQFIYPAGNYTFKVNNINTRTRSEIRSKLITKLTLLLNLLLTLNVFHTFC